MSDYYDSPNDHEYYAYEGSVSWSNTSGQEAFRELRGEEVKLISFRSPSENEDVATLVESLWSKVKTEHTKVDLGTCCHQLGREGTRLLLAKIQRDGGRWISFKAAAQKKPKGDFKPFNPLYLITDSLLQLPNLREIELSFHIDSRTIEPVRRLLSHPKLEAISLSNRGFNAGQVSSLLSTLNRSLPTSNIRHLSLAKAHTDEDYLDSLMVVLERRREGLEYLNLERSKVFQTVPQLMRLVEEVEKHNKTIQGIKLDDKMWSTEARSRLRIALVRNQNLRRRTHLATLDLLHTVRNLPHHPSLTLSSLSLEQGTKVTSFSDLPTEVLLEIVAQLETDPLSPRQVGNVVEWASDRGTLGAGRRADTAKEFLMKVDCWKWEGVEGGSV